MRNVRRAIVTAGFLGLALLPIVAAVPPEPRTSPLDAKTTVAIAQPLAVIERGPLAVSPWLPESGMMVLVGSALIGLAAVVRRATKES